MTSSQVKQELRALANPARAKFAQKFFKTYKGGYAEGDRFLGLTVPAQRLVAKKYKTLPPPEIQKFLRSKIHEYRFTALEILVMQYEKADVENQRRLVAFFLKNTRWINNWDLVDTSAPYILGDWLLHRPRTVLYTLATSPSLWEHRIAIVSTNAFIQRGEFKDTLRLAKILLGDSHDLIHKATGWMLREVGKKSLPALTRFLDAHAAAMPRTMLRYAIEKLPPAKRRHYLKLR